MDSTTAFVTSASVPTRPPATPVSKCSFVSRPTSLSTAVRPRRASVQMCKREEFEREDGYVIKESEFKDANTEDDSGDGFIGEADMDESLGLNMPEDLPGFEIRAIQNAKNREELVDRLRDIAIRRQDTIGDKRRGMGIDNADNYLQNL